MRDRTTQAVTAQVDAMGCPAYEVGVFDANKERMITKVWDRETILKSIGYLKYQNMQGNHIYIRPAGAHNLTLVDDLSSEKIDSMRQAGHSPALVIETSPNNYQAWIKHHKTLPTDLSTRVSKEIARLYGGDPGSADWRHFGRLAGFTNCKKKYQQSNGLYPFVILKEAKGQQYEKSQMLIEELERKHAAELKAERERRLRFTPSPLIGNARISKSISDFRNDPRYAGDYHRAELAYATYAISRGAAQQEVVAAIMTRDLSHKGGESRQHEYAQRTVKKAVENIQRSSRGQGLSR